MFEFIEKVVYINLENRKDRRASIEKELSIFPKEKILRFNAIRHYKGHIGCSMSHVAVIEMAIKEKWSNILIMEDDAAWTNFSKGYSILESLISKPYDVILLGSTRKNIDSNYRVKYALTATAYLVNNTYYSHILKNFNDGLKQFLIKKRSPWINCLDRYWQPLLQNDLWYAIHPNMIYQKPSYSDTERKYLDITKEFGTIGIKCERLECNYKIHSNTHCCLSCKDNNTHNLFCEKILHQLNHT